MLLPSFTSAAAFFLLLAPFVLGGPRSAVLHPHRLWARTAESSYNDPTVTCNPPCNDGDVCANFYGTPQCQCNPKKCVTTTGSGKTCMYLNLPTHQAYYLCQQTTPANGAYAAGGCPDGFQLITNPKSPTGNGCAPFQRCCKDSECGANGMCVGNPNMLSRLCHNKCVNGQCAEGQVCMTQYNICVVSNVYNPTS